MKWIRRYLEVQDEEHLNRETIIVLDASVVPFPALTRIREIHQQMNPLYYTHCQHYFLHYRRCCRCTLNLHAAPLNILKYD